MAAEHGDEEAARRYRALVLTTLRQLRGLSETRIRLVPDPPDAAEAIRFWLLPKLAERWHCEDGVFLADGWEIDFGGNDHAFQVEATGEIRCPFLSARWVHTALLGIERGTHYVTGPTTGNGEYFRAQPLMKTAPVVALEERVLPELPVVLSSHHWDEALQSPLGPALKRAWEEEARF
jgi:hypothetical protein